MNKQEGMKQISELEKLYNRTANLLPLCTREEMADLLGTFKVEKEKIDATGGIKSDTQMRESIAAVRAAMLPLEEKYGAHEDTPDVTMKQALASMEGYEQATEGHLEKANDLMQELGMTFVKNHPRYKDKEHHAVVCFGYDDEDDMIVELFDIRKEIIRRQEEE